MMLFFLQCFVGFISEMFEGKQLDFTSCHYTHVTSASPQLGGIEKHPKNSEKRGRAPIFFKSQRYPSLVYNLT